MSAVWRALSCALLATLLAAPAFADARIDYLLFCSGCHRTDGTGLPPEIPTLVDTLGRIVASREGRAYLARVPGSAQVPLSDGELAAVLNWILREFSASTLPRDFRELGAHEVGRARKEALADPAKYRREHWPDDH